MKAAIKKLIPKSALNFYHKSLAVSAATWFGSPSEKMIVIGVTGTNGKTTTTHFIAKVLETGGARTGETSTAIFKVAEKEWLNDKKMTMLGRFQLQSLLSDMVKAGCTYAVVETSSQGIEQFRHLGINYDYAVFTNLTPEHIEAHGGFDNYKHAKGKFFEWLTMKPYKTMDGKSVKKVSVINVDDEHAAYFKMFNADEKLTFGIKNPAQFKAEHVKVSTTGTTFTVDGHEFALQVMGAFNVYNALAAIAIGRNEGLSWEQIAVGLRAIKTMPGRMELIDEGQPFTVIVDYAPEPASMEKLYETVKLVEKKKVIHVLGSCGGGRDVARRPILGRLAGEHADVVIVTNEDPYDDDPQQIINDVAAGAIEKGKIEHQNLFKILDRREAIKKAISLAQPGDLVLLTGKGSEQAIAGPNGLYTPWDEREEVRKAITGEGKDSWRVSFLLPQE